MNGKISGWQGYQSWSLSRPLNNLLKPRLEAISGISMHDAKNYGAPPLWHIASCSFEQATFAAQLWSEIHRVKDEETAAIKLCALRNELLSTRHINKAATTIKRYSKSAYKDEIVPLEPLLLTDLEELRSKLSLIGNGRMTGRISSHIAEGATLLYLSNCLSQMAIVVMFTDRECLSPMKKLPRQWFTSVKNVIPLASYYMKIAGAIKVMSAVEGIVNNSMRQAVINSDLLSRVSQLIAINSVMHTINNRLSTSTGYLELIIQEINKFLEGDVGGLGQFREILDEWEGFSTAIARTAISDDEPIVYIGKQYDGVELIADGSVPGYVNITNINIMAGQFVNNSFAHPHPERKLKVVTLQSAHGISVMDNGAGISLERLHTIESCVRSGETVQTDHKLGTGSGLRDAVHLLEDIFYKGSLADRDAGNRQAMITIASKEGAGTISSITWLQKADESEADIIPDDWNYIQFLVDVEEKRMVRRADSGRLPRPISDIIATHGSFVMGAKRSA